MRMRPRHLMKGLIGGFDRVTPARLYVAAVLTALVIVHGLAPHRFAVDGMTLGLLGILVVVVLVPLLKSASLPGGTGLEFREDLDRLQKESQLAVQEQADQPGIVPLAGPGNVADTIDASTSREDPDSISVETRTSEQRAADEIVAEILREASRSPRVGLMLLSAELERAVRTLLWSSGWKTPTSSKSLRAGIERLVELGVLTSSAASALSLFTNVRNEIVHGRRVASDAEVIRALDAGIPLLRAVMAIPRERNIVAHSSVPLFFDTGATKLVPDARGVILRTVSPGGASTMYRIFPTCKADYVRGQEVSWEWGPRQWGEIWYRDPDSGEITEAWSGSMEFIGRNLDDI